MTDTISLLYFLAMITTIVRELVTIKRCHALLMTSFCNLYFSLFLFGVPALYYADVSIVVDNFTLLLGYGMTLMSFIFLQIGYKLAKPKIPSISGFRFRFNRVFTLAFILVFISFVSLYLYASGYGGIYNLMMVGHLIRGQFISSANSFTFFKHFIPISIIASLLIYNVLFVRKIYNVSVFYKIGLFVLFVAAVTESLIFIMANDGRMMAGMFVLFFVLITLKYNYDSRKISPARLASLCVAWMFIGWIIIIGSEGWMDSSRNANSYVSDYGSITDGIVHEFSFLVLGVNAAIDYIDYSPSKFMLVNDVVNGLFAWLPTTLKPMEFTDVWDFNTKYIDPHSYGQFPTSIVAQSYYDLGVFGSVIIPLLWGYCVKWTQNLFSINNDIYISTIYMVAAFYFSKSLLYFSFYNIMMNIFFIVISYFIYTRLRTKVKIYTFLRR